MNLNEYFNPVNVTVKASNYIDPREQLQSFIITHTKEQKIENIENANLAIIGVVSRKEEDLVYSEEGLLKIRESFYALSNFNKRVKIVDLGNLKNGNTYKDHEAGLRDVIIELYTLKILPVIIGAADDIIYPNYLAYQKLGKRINLVNIDSKIRMVDDREMDYKSPLWKILIENSDSIFFYTNIGYQTHFVGPKVLKYLSDQQHSSYRLGYIRSHIKEVEPIFRDTDMIGLDVSSVRQSDAFGQPSASPNGYYGEEICQLSRYAGLSAKLTSFGIYGYDVTQDVNAQTARLIAQVVWYFVDGYINKIVEQPVENNKEYTKFIVNLDNIENELVFFNSKITERWWMEVPVIKSKNKIKILISCTQDDYSMASNGDVPERWLKAFQKIN